MAFSLLGKNFVPPDVEAKVTGKAKYAEDFRAEGMLFCRVLTSPVPHARVRNIDTSEALAMEGVVAVLTADEVPSFAAQDWPILSNEPLHVGAPILAVAAVDEATCEQAIERIKLDLEPLPFTVDPLESLYPGGPNARSDANVADFAASDMPLQTVKWTAQDFAAAEPGQLPLGEPVEKWSFGDVDAAFANAALVLDESFVTAGVSHHSMEPRSAMAYWQNGKCFLHGSTQSQTAVMPALARLLGVEIDEIVYIAEFCGGGFGSKGNAYPIMVVPALMAKKVQRPVMMRTSRAEEYYYGSARPGFQGRVKLAFRADGRMIGADLFVVQENGPHIGFDDFAAAGAALSLVYQPLAMRFRAIPIETNTPPRGAMRGPGENQLAVTLEPLIDKAAAALGLDRLEIRRVNAADASARYDAAQGPVTSAYQRDALAKGAMLADWEAMKTRSGQRSGSKVRGVGIGQAFHPAGRNGYDALVRITPDGKLHIHSGAGNLGTYSYTGVSRVAAEVLKYDWANCVVERGDTRKNLPWAPTQSGSNTSFTLTRANFVAASDALAKLKEIAAMELGGAADDYDVENETVFLKSDPSKRITYAAAAERAVAVGGKYSGQEIPDDVHEITRTATAALAGTGLIGVAKDNLPRQGVVAGIAVGFVEIDLDVETGKIDILDYLGVTDCGTVIHPQSLANQVKGGAVQGFGMATSERHIYDPQNGLPGNVGLLQCKPLSYLDVPAVMKWAAVELEDPQNPVGAKGMGEPVLGCGASALLCAISDALGGHYFKRTPVVPDMIVNAVANRPQSHEPLEVNTA